MKTKPFVLVALVVTAIGVSAASGLLLGRISKCGAMAYERLAALDQNRALAGGVAKAAVRVLSSRY